MDLSEAQQIRALCHRHLRRICIMELQLVLYSYYILHHYHLYWKHILFTVATNCRFRSWSRRGNLSVDQYIRRVNASTCTLAADRTLVVR